MTKIKTENLLKLLQLKCVKRTGWINRRIPNAESVADHSWGTALLALLFADDVGVDGPEAVQMALIHDLPESEIGDIVVNTASPQMSPTRKAQLERQAMARLFPDQTNRLRQLWERYEERSDEVALFVRDMDLVDMCLQALSYRLAGTAADKLEEFFDSSARRIATELGQRLLVETRAAFDAVSSDT